MVSGVDSPVAQQNPLIEASTNVAAINQTRQGTVLNSSQLVVGKQFQAEVVASLTDGTYVVKVADVAARMQLPNSPEVGSKLSLTLLSTSPRATFLLNPPNPGEAGSTPTTASATLGASVRQLIDDFNQSGGTGPAGAGLTLQPGAAVTATALTNTNADPRLINVNTPLPDSAPATFSSAGKLVNQLVQNSAQQANVATVGKVPLLATPDVSVNTMMNALRSGVATSGVFYESHLLQWAEGSIPTAQIMQEPQAKFPLPAATPPAETQNAGAAGAQADAAKSIPGQRTTPTATGNNATITLPKEATPIIQQQLQTMEQQRFIWHGELWPGQPMEWEISQDNAQQQGQSQQEPGWQSAVHFEFPQLGSVSAQLHLTGNHLRLNISTQDAGSALMLQNHGQELANALDAAGTQLDALLIKPKTAP